METESDKYMIEEGRGIAGKLKWDAACNGAEGNVYINFRIAEYKRHFVGVGNSAMYSAIFMASQDEPENRSSVWDQAIFCSRRIRSAEAIFLYSILIMICRGEKV